MKLRGKLLFSYLILILLAFLIFYAISVPLVRSYIRGNINDSLQQEASLIKRRVTEALEEVENREEYIRTLASERITVDRLGLSSKIGLLYYSKPADAFIPAASSIEISEAAEDILIEQINNRETSPFTAVINDAAYLSTYFVSPGTRLANQKIIILVYTPLDAVRTFTQGFTRIVILVYAVVMAAAIIFALIFSSTLNKPVLLLKNQALELKARNFAARSDISTGDEFEDLSITLNAAAEELAGHSRAQREFLDNISHELKTPLMSIQGYAEGIRDGIFPADEQTLDIITDESIRLKKLVGEISYLSKLESMPDFYKTAEVDISHIIERSMDAVSGLPDARNLSITRLNINSCIIKGDSEKLLQLMINILSNCIRHARSVVFIDTEIRDDNYVITVKDDGQGFQDGEEEKIFRRFYKGTGGSTGLGLSIAMAIAIHHGGTIMAWNASPNGAVFEISLKC